MVSGPAGLGALPPSPPSTAALAPKPKVWAAGEVGRSPAAVAAAADVEGAARPARARQPQPAAAAARPGAAAARRLK